MNAPNLAPYVALTPGYSLYETNRRTGDIKGADASERKKAAQASLKMSFDGPDEAPSDKLNRILWHDVKGWKTPYPGVQHSLFLPMSVDIADEDREEKMEEAAKERRERAAKAAQAASKKKKS